MTHVKDMGVVADLSCGASTTVVVDGDHLRRLGTEFGRIIPTDAHGVEVERIFRDPATGRVRVTLPVHGGTECTVPPCAVLLDRDVTADPAERERHRLAPRAGLIGGDR